jgi:3'-phosphoadenosine 5'-phosphosulfate sulfotransferase (PAPS reductase)/FAD synthetase
MKREHSVAVVVPISGGKDSQLCLKLALQNHPAPAVRGLFCDTRFDHPDTFAHIEKLRTLYGPVRIDTVCAGSVPEKVLKHGRFPSFSARHCTEELKIVPTKYYLRDLARAQGSGFQVWYGVRSAESGIRAKRYAGMLDEDVHLPHEYMRKYPKYLGKLGVRMRTPILSWSTADVLAALDGEENPLYAKGFDRVGCFPCLASSDKWKRKAFDLDAFGAVQLATVEQLQKTIRKSVWTTGNKAGVYQDPDDTGCAVCTYG